MPKLKFGLLKSMTHPTAQYLSAEGESCYQGGIKYFNFV